MKVLLLVIQLCLIENALGEGKVIYEYKKYEKFDLGNLEVQGELIAPGDISVRERDRKKFNLDFFERKDFNSFVKQDIEAFR
ncbi:MAG TPA: hypothetical protein VKY27_05540 [Bacteriovoracaceae bacterium]|nr:hypothetical protein [Bacteriovoracaceae bacterium]